MPQSGLAFRVFVDVGAGVVDSDYQGEVGAVLFNHSVKDFPMKTGDCLTQIILEKIKNPVIKKVATLGNTNHGARGLKSIGMQSNLESCAQERLSHLPQCH